ncbi:hypothetical protein Pse7429DRAFT_3846 [Pseudanabaena biceps PCC 7429]|uniref:Uncharacterized protein n=1 Tax=Pseudanabaena biceps PCC 7429 TaxID=927668 RepID=L8MXZ9_9CYAN|nr:hypothetical protein Pse7429DRAFT_3846 [Pseudanabaena biceps PCC 7429]
MKHNNFLKYNDMSDKWKKLVRINQLISQKINYSYKGLAI